MNDRRDIGYKCHRSQCLGDRGSMAWSSQEELKPMRTIQIANVARPCLVVVSYSKSLELQVYE